MKKVSESLLQEVRQRLVEQFHPEQIILFGSQVWGAPAAGSDLDIMVIVTHNDLSDYERSLLGHRSLSGLDIAKDIIVRTRAEFDFFRQASASLEYKISKKGKILYERR
ncbi:MAG: nucleotidyltransferase domain-containing protein [Candidatus Edwardsbacteria bacterium]|nr:nucleotidyltransferase domain-containing protein [Candidatus Edwardsbacteria bacterium]